MSLLTRLVNPNPGEDKLPVHQFMAGLAEYKRGAVTKNQFVNAFGLSGAEATQLDEFLSGLDLDSTDRSLIHDVLMLAEAGYYTNAQVKARLGLTSD